MNLNGTCKNVLYIFTKKPLCRNIFVDVNECDEAMDTCEQLCTNVPGSYKCSCRQGYTFNSSTHACDPGIYIYNKTDSNDYDIYI